MRKIILLCCFIIGAVTSSQAQEWLTDIDEAKKIASEKNRKIILVFQGSDWNGICIRLDKEMWSNHEFVTYAQDHFVMLKADFPRRAENRLSDEQLEKNKKLKKEYNLNGTFPHVVVLNKDGDVLGTTGYKKISPYMYIKVLNSFGQPENK